MSIIRCICSSIRRFRWSLPTELTTLIARILAGDQELTLLCVEGSIIHGPHGTGMFDTFEGKPKKDVIRALCEKAEFVLAMGTCSSYGGIPAAPPNPTESSGLQFTNDRPGGLLDPEWRSGGGLPVLNLAGCPVDPATITDKLTPQLEAALERAINLIHGEAICRDSTRHPAALLR